MKWRQLSSSKVGNKPADDLVEPTIKVNPMACASGLTRPAFLVNDQRLYTYYETLGCLVQADLDVKIPLEKNFHIRKCHLLENKNKGSIQTTCELHLQGAQTITGSLTFCRDLPFSTGKSTQGLGETFDLESPMTGKIIKYLVEPGQKVELGQALVIIEAMKMENQIPAPCSGTILDLTKAPGLAVQVGERLLGIKT